MLYILLIIVIIILLIIIIIARIKYYNIINLLNEPLNKEARIAVCISGRIDNLEYCYNSWNKYFLEKYTNIDILNSYIIISLIVVIYKIIYYNEIKIGGKNVNIDLENGKGYKKSSK